jgi:hypothetical protein
MLTRSWRRVLLVVALTLVALVASADVPARVADLTRSIDGVLDTPTSRSGDST